MELEAFTAVARMLQETGLEGAAHLLVLLVYVDRRWRPLFAAHLEAREEQNRVGEGITAALRRLAAPAPTHDSTVEPIGS